MSFLAPRAHLCRGLPWLGHIQRLWTCCCHRSGPCQSPRHVFCGADPSPVPVLPSPPSWSRVVPPTSLLTALMTATAGQPPAGLLGHGTPHGNHGGRCNLCHHLLGLCWPGWLRGCLHPVGSGFSDGGGIPSSSSWPEGHAGCLPAPRGAVGCGESLVGSSCSDPAPCPSHAVEEIVPAGAWDGRQHSALAPWVLPGHCCPVPMSPIPQTPLP